MIENQTDQQLLNLLANGSRQAFEAIYHRYASELYRYARKNIPLKEDCEEIIQDVFESLWVRHQALNIESLRHYLLTSIRYRIIRYFRHKKVKQKYATHFRAFEIGYETLEKEETDPETIYATVLQHIAQLPERCKMVITLRITEGLSYKEIAQRMNITQKTVELHMNKAFNHLRASYDKIYKPG